MNLDDQATREALMNRAVDGLITEAEGTALAAWLSTHPEDDALLSDLRAIKSTTDAVTARILADAALGTFGPTPAPVRLAFLLLALSALLLGGFGLFHLYSADAPLILRVAATLALVGGGLLFARAVWPRLSARDPYEDIDL